MLAGLAASSGPAAAAWEVSATQGLAYQDNLLHASAGQEAPDWESSTSLGGSATLAWQRQALNLAASVTRYQYADHGDRDHQGNQLRLNWSWSTLHALSGQFGLTSSTSAYTYSGGLDVSEPALTRQNGVSGQIRLGQAGPWSVVLAAQRNTSRYSLEVLQAQATTQDSTQLTVGWRQSARTEWQWVASHGSTASVRRTAGSRPSSSTDSLQAALNYTASPQTRLRLSLGRSRATSSSGTASPSTVGGLQLGWQPTPRTNVQLSWQRDARSSLQNLSPPDGATDPTVPDATLLDESSVEQLSLQWSWAATARGQLRASLSQQNTDSRSAVQGGQVLRLGGSLTRKLELGWSQSIGRSWQGGCGWRQEQLDVRGSSGSRPYQAATTYCNLSLRMQ